MNAVRQIAPALEGHGQVVTTQVVVVDDGSSDQTSDMAQPFADLVVRLHNRRGKGAALQIGVSFATGAIVLFCDADVGRSAANFWALVLPVLKGEADMTIATPPPDPTGGFGLVRRFASLLVRLWTGTTLSMPLSGQRAVKRSVLDRIPLAFGYAAETAMCVTALRAGFRLLEVPLPLTHRSLRRTVKGFLHRARQLRDIALWALTYFLSGRW